ncbi:hypothetical protein NUACC21_15440 [Scytonema sp. NUACC21]
MPKLIKDLLLPLLIVLCNGALSWLTNQLPAYDKLGIPQSVIIGLTGLCIIAVFVLGLLSTQTQPSSTSHNQNWLSGLLPLLGGAILFGLLKLSFLPPELNQLVSFIALILFGAGTVLPPTMLLLPQSQLLPQQQQKWVVRLAIAVFLGLTLHFLFIQQWYSALWSLVLALLIIWRKFLFQFIDLMSQKWEVWQQQLAVNLVSKLEFWWWEFTSQFQAKYYKYLIYTYRTYRTQGLKTPGAFTPDLDKVFVPLRVSSKSPVQMSTALIQKETSGDLKIWDFLGEIHTTPIYKHMVIIAPPGYGKTTLLEHLTLTYAHNTQRRQYKKAPNLIPILLYLRKIRDLITNPQPPNLAQLVTEVVRADSQESSIKLDPPLRWFEDRLRSGKCLVMLDGLDEVADINQRQQVSQWVDVQMKAYPETTFILTSRPYGYLEAQLQQQPFCLEVQPFNLKQMQEFINNWYLQNEIIRQGRKEDPGVQADARKKANDLIGRIKNNSALAAMALNPLLLTMIATVHDNRGALPGSRVELYAEICEVLLARRQEVKGIGYPIQLKAAQKQSVLQVLALKLMQQETREFTPDVGEQIIQQQLNAVAGSTVKPQEFLKHIEQASGLILEKQQGVCEFAHKSFQEYLTAVQIKEENDEQLLKDNINNSWWDETIRLYAAKNDTTHLIEEALKSSTVISLSLAYDCLQEGMSVAPAVRQELENTLESGLESNDSQIFQLAAQVQLRRRLSKFVRIDEQLEIDLDSYITGAEYQLFLNETGQSRLPQHWQSRRFPSGDAKKTISGIEWEDANRFCVWLKSWSKKQGLSNQLSEEVTFYRLPTEKERNEHPIKDDQHLKDSGIRIVKCQLPILYSQLADYLLSGEWQKADEETAKVMLKVANRESKGYLDVLDLENFPCPDLHTIDQLWVYASKGYFGFSVQKNIYQSLGGTRKYNEKIWEAFGDCVGWRTGGEWLEWENITYTLNAQSIKGHLPSPTSTWGAFFALLLGTTRARGQREGVGVGDGGTWRGISSLAQRLVDCNT